VRATRGHPQRDFKGYFCSGLLRLHTTHHSWHLTKPTETLLMYFILFTMSFLHTRLTRVLILLCKKIFWDLSGILRIALYRPNLQIKFNSWAVFRWRRTADQLYIACFTYFHILVVWLWHLVNVMQCNVVIQWFSINYCCQTIVYQHIVMMGIIFFFYMLLWYIAMSVSHTRYALATNFRMLT